MIEEAMIIALKITLIFQGVFIFYLFGKYEKIPQSARNIFFVVVNAGCLFLASGLIKNNYFLKIHKRFAPPISQLLVFVMLF